MAKTMLLDQTPWDLCVDAAGNWAVASEPYAQAQDAASEIRVFAGECYYNTALGVAYFSEAYGLGQPTQILRAQIQAAAERVPGVTEANAVLTVVGSTLTGQVQLSTPSGVQVITL